MTDDKELEMKKEIYKELWMAFIAGLESGTANPLLFDLPKEEKDDVIAEMFVGFVHNHEEELKPYLEERSATHGLQEMFESFVEEEYQDD